MIKKSDIVREAVKQQDWKKALQIAKDFKIGVTQEQRDKMARAYECIVHPDFYRQIGIDIPDAIEQGKAVVKEYAECRRKEIMMKWDVKHDRAKRVIDAFLDNAGCWKEREDLVEGLTDEEKELVNEEVVLMIASIRKRYKLDVKLPKQEPQIQPEVEKVEIPTEEVKETVPEPVNEDKKEEKPKRGRKTSDGEKKAPARKLRTKKTEKEEKQDEEI